MLFRHAGAPASFTLVPVLIVLQFLLVLGLTFPLSALSVYYYDVRHMLPIVLTALFYLSPVFYTSKMVPEPYRIIYFLNPIAGLMYLYRTILYDASFPSPAAMFLVTVQIILIFGIGYVIFSRHKINFAEVI